MTPIRTIYPHQGTPFTIEDYIEEEILIGAVPCIILFTFESKRLEICYYITEFNDYNDVSRYEYESHIKRLEYDIDFEVLLA